MLHAGPAPVLVVSDVAHGRSLELAPKTALSDLKRSGVLVSRHSLDFLVSEVENPSDTIIRTVVADYPEIRFFCLLVHNLTNGLV